jgi:hypothetical protein
MLTPRPLSLVAASALFLLVALPAHAVSNRIFMSTNGNDAGDCANPLTPCLTFNGALAQVNPGGEVIAEATGGYGALTIHKAVTISGPPGVVIYSGLQVTVNAPGDTVVLRGLTIDGAGAAGNGIRVVAVGSLFIENCVVANFSGSFPNGIGIYFTTGGTFVVQDTLVRNNGFVGIWVNPTSGTATASFEHCKIEGNTFGLSVISTGNVATATNCIAVGNSAYGFGAEGGGELNLDNCVSSNNGEGVSSISSTVRVSGTTVTDNGVGLSGSSLLSRQNNTVQGNTTKGAFTGTFTAD